MSKRFNPLSTAVAIATATVLVAAGGCAMGTRSNDDNAALSHEPDRSPKSMEQGAPSSALDQSAMTTTTVETSPAPVVQLSEASPAIQPAQETTVIAQGDTSATPAVPPQTSAPLYTSSSTDTTAATTTTTTTPSTSSTDTSLRSGSDQPLAPRADRN